MNVMIFKERIDPHSGYSKHILEVSKRLCRSFGYRFSIVTTGLAAPLSLPEGIELHTLLGSPSRYTWTARRPIDRLIQQIRPDLVDFHGGPGSVLLARHPAVPTVFSMHSGKHTWRDYAHVRWGDLWAERTQLFGAGYLLNLALPPRLLQRALRWRGVCAMSVPTRALRTSVAAISPLPVSFIPSGIDSGAQVGAPQPLPPGRWILFYGKSQRLRGIDTLLAAFEAVAQAQPHARLLLVLRPNLSTERLVKQARAHPARDRIVVEVGTFSNVERFLAAAEIVVLPFRAATALPAQPLTLLEAMASGKPVISTTIAPVTDVVVHERDGLLVAPNRPRLLARQIVRLLEDPALGKCLGQRGREKVLSCYGWDRIARDTDRFYRNALGASKGQG